MPTRGTSPALRVFGPLRVQTMCLAQEVQRLENQVNIALFETRSVSST